MADSIDTLLDLASSFFRVERATLTADADLFDALGIDSLKALELMSEVELTFDVEIPDYELQDVRTFAQLWACIEARR